MIKQKKCKYCKELFLPKGFNQKNCYKDECISQFYQENKKKIELKSKQNKTKVKKEAKDKLKGIREFKADLQKEINTIVRLIDKDCVCICSQKKHNANDAGHYYSRGSTPELAYNLNNIYLQSVHSNRDLSGDIIRFQEGLETMYSKEHKEFVHSLKGMYPPFKPTKEELKEYIKKAREIVKELNVANANYTAEERLILRNKYNERIGIYK